jgi:hypothetical protein
MQGYIFDGIEVHSGVRQGCPLSGLLFALCMDVLLERIDALLHGDEQLGAFADDIAVVVENFWVSVGPLEALFKEFRSISALSLNVKKTLMIPLWPCCNQANVARLVKEECPGWGDISIVGKGKYLGFLLGPEAGEEGWNKPLAKFESRVRHWADMKLGMAMNAVAFNVYIVPVLEFVAQLLCVTERVRTAMGWAMRRLASGPGTWFMQRDLENLVSFGLKAEFRTIEMTARAAKLRVLMDVAKDAATQQDELERTQSEYLRRPFGVWHSKSFFKILLDNKTELERNGATTECIHKAAKKAHRFGKKKEKNAFQKVARKVIKARCQPFDAEDRIRTKIRRWGLKGPPAHVARRIANNLKIVGRRCRPCVAGMFFRTLWNGWPTTARMRSMKGAPQTGECLLGCLHGDDKIEHYLVCEQAWTELTKPQPQGIGLSFARRTRESMLLAERGLDESEVAKIARAVYAIARTVHCVRAHGRVSNPGYILRRFL